MKKAILLIILVCSTALFLQSCVKTCTCENPDTGKPVEIEVSPSDNCSDHSGATYKNCS